MMLSRLLTSFAWLVIAHFVTDYQFQSSAVARGKSHKNDPPFCGVPWYYWMLAHSCCHGVAVFLCTLSYEAAWAEIVVHFAIDHLKCRGWYGIHVDQALHVLCKAAWVLLLHHHYLHRII